MEDLPPTRIAVFIFMWTPRTHSETSSSLSFLEEKIKLRTIRQSSQTVCCFFYYREIQVSTLATPWLHNKICLALARQPVLGLREGAGRGFPMAFVLRQTRRGSALLPLFTKVLDSVNRRTHNSLLT